VPYSKGKRIHARLKKRQSSAISKNITKKTEEERGDIRGWKRGGDSVSRFTGMDVWGERDSMKVKKRYTPGKRKDKILDADWKDMDILLKREVRSILAERGKRYQILVSGEAVWPREEGRRS